MKKNKSERKASAIIPAVAAEGTVVAVAAESSVASVKSVLISDATPEKGRPVNPESDRQKRIAAMEAKREAGEALRQGRPVNPESNRQKRVAEYQAKLAAGVELKRGRPTNPESERQKRLAVASTKPARIKLVVGQNVIVNDPKLEGMSALHVVRLTNKGVLVQNGDDEMGYLVPKSLIQIPAEQ